MEDAARLHAEEEAMRLGQLEALRNELESESQQRAEDERQLSRSIEALRVEETQQRAGLEGLRQHAAELEEAKRLRVLEESNLSAKIAAREVSIVRDEEPRVTEWLELSTEHEASASTGENHLQNSQHAEAELLVPVETQIEVRNTRFGSYF